MSTTTNLTTLKINYLTQAQYNAALSGGTINEDEIYLTPQSGSTTNPYVTSQGVSGDWRYRVWSNNFIEVWFNGSVTFTSASTSYQGWYRSTLNVTIPAAVRDITGDFADTANIQVTGAHNAHIYTSGGIKTNGTAFEAQMLGMNSVAANTATTGWNVYIAGMARS